MHASLITGLAGPDLTPDEARFLAGVRPCGLILFTRNCVTPDQVRRLVADAKDAIGTGDILVLVDQEGGRVARLRAPFTEWPPMITLGRSGDTALAAFATAWAAGWSIEEAVELANLASGIAVTKVGTAVVTQDELRQAGTAGAVSLPPAGG